MEFKDNPQMRSFERRLELDALVSLPEDDLDSTSEQRFYRSYFDGDEIAAREAYAQLGSPQSAGFQFLLENEDEKRWTDLLYRGLRLECYTE